METDVREAEYTDIRWIVEEAAVRMLTDEVKQPALYNATTLTEIVAKAIQTRTLFIGSVDGIPVGAIGGIVVPHYLNNEKSTLAEIMWYILPEHRGSRVGLKMLKMYAEKAREFDYASFSLLASSPISDRTLEKLGFRLTERNYLMEQ